MTHKKHLAVVTVLAGGAASDTTRPTCTITSASSGTTAGAFTCTFTFSEDVTGFAVGDITCSANAGAGTFATVSGSVYTAVITPTAIGAVTVDVAEGVCADGAGNTNTAATQFSIVSTTITAPAITPTLNNEVLVNPGFEGTYDTEAAGIDIAPDWNNLGLDAGTDTAAKETTTIHGGSASQSIVTDASNEGVTPATNSFAAGWYQISFWVYRVTGSFKARDSNNRLAAPEAGMTNTWVQSIGTGHSSGAAALWMTTNNAFNGYIDDASVKPFVLASMMTSVGTLDGRNGTYTCHPTVTVNTQAGMVIAYKDASNFVLAVLHHAGLSGITCKLMKYIAGVWATDVKSGTVTYSAGAELKVVVNGTTYQLFYNGTQVSTDATISDSLGYGVYGFNTYAGNTVGVVTANP
jgi:hypothetical protein